ncbi:SDR family NAD(P)-dependent oxidoreductase [Streptomyces sp. NBC_01390]|uniref:SDR family NAD(P)-dependent oxidoreductase n=1 Tax=Streptomyces sp. 900129855 TaxID=3155129 RepID=A0ABV2ZX57_9ACTN|nr:SDR family NAD(P)-dependent oxidoreductase [Streptomyces sp. AK08-02]MDX3749178.1 SDR family NAD(P)-dependent oxidoreductase [Streptomyces sp. AK08-02]
MGIRDGKVAIITGGAKGMGEAHVRRFVEEGAKVVVADLDVASGEKLAIGLGEGGVGHRRRPGQQRRAGEQLLALLDGKGLGDITVEGEASLLDTLLSVVERLIPGLRS